jgi:DNA-binding CsgD family transcriptional regulator
MPKRDAIVDVPGELVVTSMTIGGEELAVIAFPLPETACDPRLSPAERAVLERVIRGESNSEIARARKTSPRTVANQLASIFQKVGVGSRRELVTRSRRRA